MVLNSNFLHVFLCYVFRLAFKQCIGRFVTDVVSISSVALTTYCMSTQGNLEFKYNYKLYRLTSYALLMLFSAILPMGDASF